MHYSPFSASADVEPTLRSARAELKFSATIPTWALIERRYHRGSKFRIPEASQPFFGEFEGAEDGAGFVQAFLVFAGGDGVGDDAGAGLHAGYSIFDEYCSAGQQPAHTRRPAAVRPYDNRRAPEGRMPLAPLAVPPALPPIVIGGWDDEDEEF